MPPHTKALIGMAKAIIYSIIVGRCDEFDE